MDSPNPDSGEEYFHTNAQLYNRLEDHNRFKIGDGVDGAMERAATGCDTDDGRVRHRLHLHLHRRDRPSEQVDLQVDNPSSMLSGEAFLDRVYDAYRSATSETGANLWNTVLLIGWDEQGGTYDHVPPGPVPVPDPSAPPGECDFTFDRSLAAPRDPTTWATVTPHPVPAWTMDLEAVGKGLSTLGKGMGPSLIARAREMGAKLPPELDDPHAALTPGLVVPVLRDVAGHFFPLLSRQDS